LSKIGYCGKIHTIGNPKTLVRWEGELRVQYITLCGAQHEGGNAELTAIVKGDAYQQKNAVVAELEYAQR